MLLPKSANFILFLLVLVHTGVCFVIENDVSDYVLDGEQETMENRLKKIEGKIMDSENRVLEKLDSVAEAMNAQFAALQTLMERQVLSLRNAWDLHSTNIVEQVSDQIQKSESNLQSKGSLIVKKIHDIQSNLTRIGDCRETKVDGLYTLQLPNRTTEMVRCDRGFTGNGWILIYKRVSSDVNFTRDWTSYVEGFGNPFMDYWIGLESLHRITSSGAYEININSFECGRFEIGGAEEDYRITKTDATYSRHKLASILKQGSPFNTFDRNELGEDNQEYLLQKNFSFWGDDYTYNMLRNKKVYDEQFSLGKRWIAIRRIVTDPTETVTTQESIDRKIDQESSEEFSEGIREQYSVDMKTLMEMLTRRRID